MKKVLMYAFLAMFLAAQTSCAVMFNGSKQDVSIASMTPESKIYVNGELVGEDNVKVRLPRKSNHTITVKKDGYATEHVSITKELQVGWVVFDALLNWFAFLTDAPTGAWNAFDKDNITVELEKESAPTTGSQPNK